MSAEWKYSMASEPNLRALFSEVEISPLYTRPSFCFILQPVDLVPKSTDKNQYTCGDPD